MSLSSQDTGKHCPDVTSSQQHFRSAPLVICRFLLQSLIGSLVLFALTTNCHKQPTDSLHRMRSRVTNSQQQQQWAASDSPLLQLNNDNRHHVQVQSSFRPIKRFHAFNWTHHGDVTSSESVVTEVPRNGTTENQLQTGRQQRLPQAIIVGVKKGGTRALLEFLRVHPDVRAPGPEIHFFDRNFDKGVDWYRSRMPATLPGQLTLEKTPSYLVTRHAAERVLATLSPSVRLLVVVRDPVTRAVSDYAQAVSKRPDYGSFESRAFVNGSAVDATWGPIRIGIYARHVRPWLERFPRILYVSGEQLIVDPARQMADVERFLGLRPFLDERHFYFNATKGFPCLLLRTSAGRGRDRSRCLGKNKGRVHPRVDPNALQRLRAFYRPHNEKFYRLTGVSFGWT